MLAGQVVLGGEVFVPVGPPLVQLLVALVSVVQGVAVLVVQVAPRNSEFSGRLQLGVLFLRDKLVDVEVVLKKKVVIARRDVECLLAGGRLQRRDILVSVAHCIQVTMF